MKVLISEACDGFTLTVLNEEDQELWHMWFNQEDTKEGLVTFFEGLGMKAEYEEAY